MEIPQKYHFSAWDKHRKMDIRFQSVMIEYSESKNYEEAIYEWELNSSGDRAVNSAVEQQCICSHNITDEYYVSNNKNRNILIIGSECINKFGTNELIEGCKISKNSKIYESRKHKSKKHPCANCGKHRISDTGIKIFCGPCTDKGITEPSKNMIRLVGVKQCTVCNKQMIKTIEADQCSECEMKQTMRQCIECQEYEIDIDEPDYVVRCRQCYYELKNKNDTESMRQCIECQEYKIEIDRPQYVVRCGKGYYELKNKSKTES